uniref:Uncharacterized protein n=1 Tax=Arundo donax TaxID=35708 RepID=A0A0A9AYK6_ARUDO
MFKRRQKHPLLRENLKSSLNLSSKVKQPV